MFLLVGLGNPDREYVATRHNAGFLAIDHIHRRYMADCVWRAGFDSFYTRGDIAGEAVLLQKPTTYMNHSGRAVHALMRYYKISTDRMIIFHDELDIPACTVRFKIGGGYGGHKGLLSIGSYVGGDFMRLRIGIGRPLDIDKMSPADWVLSRFSDLELADYDRILSNLSAGIGYVLRGDRDRFVRTLGKL